jgi:hypothetical protein
VHVDETAAAPEPPAGPEPAAVDDGVLRSLSGAPEPTPPAPPGGTPPAPAAPPMPDVDRTLLDDLTGQGDRGEHE